MIIHKQNHGITLVEVLAGLAIISTVLVGVIVAKNRLTKQLARNNQRLQAIEVADDLLIQWWRDIDNFPRNQTGTPSKHDNLTWKTQVLPSPQAEKLNCEIVRLEIFKNIDESSELSAKALVCVDLTIPLPEEDNEGEDI